MKIIKNEIKKIVKSPIIIGLTTIFIIFNLFIINQKFSCREDLKVLNKIVKEVGYKIDENMLVNFRNYYKQNLKEANKIINSKSRRTYKTLAEFYDEMNGMGLENYSKEEQKKIKETAIIESYYYYIDQNDIDYKEIDLEKLAEGDIKAMRLSGALAETARENYKNFQERLDNIRTSGEYRSLFFQGQAYAMHSFLFKDILRNIIFEIAILVCLIIAFIVNYEFDNNTSLITYSTKRGRNLVKDKILAGLISINLITTIILGITLGVYFSVFSYDGLWKVPISSYFNWEPSHNMPFTSWFSINLWQYLVLSIILVYAVEMIFVGIVFLINRVTKNTYIAFSLFFIIGAFAILLPSFLPTNNNCVIYSTFTPFSLIMNPQYRFMLSGAFTNYKYYELITVFIWGTAILVTSVLSIKKFKKEDLK
ncbi:hypothetical protein [Clostridium brassicae]|uniref:ABC transporter permease n=1 Tax=Clostridium brassicae TaxID=2999072 RepID=A0ABT4D9R2_9CLOT|nr:hypothetical protein [Clostridium brassicae]MCY6958383.1 hypothetical protein [Clostridium brassicae]